MSAHPDRWRFGFALSMGMLSAILAAGCSPGPVQREVALRATVEALRDEMAQLRAATLVATATPAVPTPSSPSSSRAAAGAATVPAREWWVANHRATTLWSASLGGKPLASVPQWTYFLVLEPHVDGKLHLFMPGGQRSSYLGDAWADAADLGPVGAPQDGVVDLSTLPKRQAGPPKAVVAAEPTAMPRPLSASVYDTRLLDWREVNASAEAGDLELKVNALLLGQDSYGGLYGSRISSTRGTKILLADLSLAYAFRPGASSTEVHVDFFVIGDPDGNEYRGLPVPIANAMPDRYFLSPGQSFRGIAAFIFPVGMKSGRLYFTNFLGSRNPPERLTVYLREIP